MQRPHLNTVIEFESQQIKVLFSHQNRRIHSTMVPLLKDFLSHELGKNVEVVSRFSAWDTLYAATDNVFDLVILAHSYESKDLSSQDLIKKIKKLDQSIPIIQFSSQEDGTNKQTDGCYPLPKSRQELRPIAHFFKDYKRYFKKS